MGCVCFWCGGGGADPADAAASSSTEHVEQGNPTQVNPFFIFVFVGLFVGFLAMCVGVCSGGRKGKCDSLNVFCGE